MGKIFDFAFIPLKRKFEIRSGINSLYRCKNIGIYPEIKSAVVPSSGRKRYCRENAGSALKEVWSHRQAGQCLFAVFDVAELKRIKNELEPKNGDGSQSGSTLVLRIPTE